MRRLPDFRYGDDIIVIHVWPTPGNTYRSSFSVHRPSYPKTKPEQVAIVYQEGRERGAACETADNAHQDAIERASTWIDAHPPKA